MKLISCDLCGSVIQLRLRKKSCQCKNISGKYKPDGKHVIIWTKDKKTSRVVVLPNSVRYGIKQEWQAWVIDWNDPVMQVKMIK